MSLVIEHQDLVRKIAWAEYRKLSPDALTTFDDLVQSGMEGLLDAATRFDDGRGAKFSTYAAIRIRGSMMDELRRSDMVSRSERSKGNSATNEEYNDEEQVSALCRATSFGWLMNLCDPELTEHDPQAMLQIKQVAERLRAAVARLTERDILILEKVNNGERLRTIAATLGITTVRVSQLRIRALEKIREAMVE
jgi:RNA polymerase sigma factor for flagellar operon FliA